LENITENVTLKIVFINFAFDTCITFKGMYNKIIRVQTFMNISTRPAHGRVG